MNRDLAKTSLQYCGDHTQPCALERAAHRACWASFRIAEDEGIYNDAPTVSLLVDPQRPAQVDAETWAHCLAATEILVSRI